MSRTVGVKRVSKCIECQLISCDGDLCAPLVRLERYGLCFLLDAALNLHTSSHTNITHLPPLIAGIVFSIGPESGRQEHSIASVIRAKINVKGVSMFHKMALQACSKFRSVMIWIYHRDTVCLSSTPESNAAPTLQQQQRCQE